MSGGLAKQLAAGLGALFLWTIGVLQQVSLKAGRWTPQEVFLWQWRLSLRVALLALLFFVAAHHKIACALPPQPVADPPLENEHTFKEPK